MPGISLIPSNLSRRTTLAVATLLGAAFAAEADAQVCYESHSQCFTFGPLPGDHATKLDTGDVFQLNSDRFSLEGDLRLRIRSADAPSDEVYNGRADQQATRGRVRGRFQATEQIAAVVEYNFSETWAGSESYSDALAGQNFDGISQFYIDAKDMFGFEDNWRIGRSEYILGNGLILGSCDYLQRPGTFTGVWFSRPIEQHNFELFVFDDRGPLQAQHPGVRYAGGTASLWFDEHTDRYLSHVKPYVMFGTEAGDQFPTPPSNPTEKDVWIGLDLDGNLPSDTTWFVEVAHRFVDDNKNRTAVRATVVKVLDLFDGVLHSGQVRFTDSSGKMDVGNPADFNSAGLVHQYGGAWCSDLQTVQVGANVKPGWDLNGDITVLALNARDNTPQLGDYELDAVVGRWFPSGIYASVGYGIDNDRRQVGFGQLTLNF